MRALDCIKPTLAPGCQRTRCTISEAFVARLTNIVPAVTIASSRYSYRRPAWSQRKCFCNALGDDGPNSSLPVPEEDAPLVMPVAGADTDWREFRARLVTSMRVPATTSAAATESSISTYSKAVDEQRTPEPTASGEPASSAADSACSCSSLAGSHSWAHSLPRPEKGCLLLAHPMLFHTSQTYFYQAVILVVEHSDQHTLGLILNKPSNYCLSELQLTHELPEFKDAKLYCGGDVGGGEVTLLHTRPQLFGSIEVVKGMYMGGVQGAQQAVATGQAKVDDFRWFAKYSGWGPGQLEAECRRGVWFAAAASPDVVLSDSARGDGLWHHVLRLMGGDYELLSYNVLASEERQKQRRAALLREQQLRALEAENELSTSVTTDGGSVVKDTTEENPS